MAQDRRPVSRLAEQFFTINPHIAPAAIDAAREDEKSAALGGLFRDDQGRFYNVDHQVPARAGRFLSDAHLSRIFSAACHDRLTPAELKLVKDLLCGHSLREVSARDGVSYETRRNQLKCVFSKFGVSRQTDLLLRLSAFVVAHQEARADARGVRAEGLRSLLAKHWACEQRVYPFTSESGQQLLVAELGPVTGRPVLMIHAAFFCLYPLPSKAHVLNELNIRLIVPLRSGYFGTPLMQEGNRAADALHLDLLAEMISIFRLQDVPVICFATGANYGMALVQRAVIDPARMLCVSADYAGPRGLGTPSLHFRAALRLAETAPRLALRFYRTALAAARSRAATRFGFGKYFGTSKLEATEVSAMMDQSGDLAAFQEIIAASLEGFIYDLPKMKAPLPAIRQDQAQALRFVFAEHEPYSDVGAFQRDRVYGQGQIEIMTGLGRLGILDQPAALFARLLDRRPAKTTAA